MNIRFLLVVFSMSVPSMLMASERLDASYTLNDTALNGTDAIAEHQKELIASFLMKNHPIIPFLLKKLPIIPQTLDHSNAVHSAAFNDVGDLVLTTASDQTVNVWDLNGNCLKTFIGLSGRTKPVVSNGPRDMIVTTSSDQTARIWGPNGKCLKILTGHTDNLNSAAFSNDADMVVTTSNDKTARIWDLTKLNSIVDYFTKDNRISLDQARLLNALYEVIVCRRLAKIHGKAILNQEWKQKMAARIKEDTGIDNEVWEDCRQILYDFDLKVAHFFKEEEKNEFSDTLCFNFNGHNGLWKAYLELPQPIRDILDQFIVKPNKTEEDTEVVVAGMKRPFTRSKKIVRFEKI